ncbi:hypothetical protein A2V61_01145 [Candidatus Woesebacteria bacterium RBG_19FT_COMBO_47_8]|uniref:Probable fructose-bisphosphate aldolase class 1 n=1 Tax=Candidatus Woesebacteria bacterium RBG_13_46_13 TaxID=1802479 RepID=A0A1F7X4X8_9BACT|nr:MAG: hypothetical protein A2Y68_01610 [Candidatus Woesebacteria bacterium RBG_13_46_13]OGM17995.1 MAG: hypothetical protein A2V61_01145 [Candidatus Woesebacteria bacterium RBG_19FT_COMBO_47_8]HJX59280.1 class I fructose-bisphosphate aldolase [Patescibacteria group bacterium]
MDKGLLESVASQLVAPTKGLLAADESTGTITKRFETVGLTSTPELNRKYRQMLFTTAGIEEFLSGIILFDETAWQKTDDGVSFPEYLIKRGIAPGIKVDEGREALNVTEELAKGLEGLADRLKKYAAAGFKFTKWRAPFVINDIYPSKEAVSQNVQRMTEYAKVSQEEGLVPIVEPEVLLEGNHTTTRCGEVTVDILTALFTALKEKQVNLKGLLLKTNMVLPGKDSGVKAAPLEVAQATLRTVLKSVPQEVPGIVFLSGGQSPEEATANLNEINKLKKDAPWELSFSFARALQAEALDVWQGKDEDIGTAQAAFYRRAKSVSLARQGKYE